MHALPAQLPVHPGPAIGASAGLEDGADASGELLVGEAAGRRTVLVPLVEGGAGDLEQLARLVDGVVALRLLRLDEGEHLHRVSLAKKAVALA